MSAKYSLSTREGVLICFYGLIASLFLNSLTLTIGLTVTTFVIWFIQSLPLAIFIPALHRGGTRACAWLSFVVLMYFVHGVLAAFTPGQLLAGLIEVGFCGLLFTALILYIRNA